MSKFIVKPTPVEGIMIVKFAEGTAPVADELLSAVENSELNELLSPGDNFVQQRVERYPRGVLRGIYFQRRDAQARLLRVSSGSVLAVGVDLRPESKEYGAAHSANLSVENGSMLYIPPYYGYGFLTLEADTEVVELASREDDPTSQSGIIWDDEILAIDWQLERYDIDRKRLNISQRDKKLSSFRSYNPNALWLNRPKINRRR
ncbi:MAG: dTDP-4-dehydrorhamnose 3,5-epimerase [Rikenellaceae bacterium]